MSRHYEVTPRAPHLGGGWNLKLIEDGQEAGGGVFPIVGDDAAARAWWGQLEAMERAQWLRRVGDDATPEQAYLAHLGDEAHLDATEAGDEWIGGVTGQSEWSPAAQARP